MRKYIIISVLALLTFSGLQAQSKVDNFQIQVDGLGCPFCAYGLEKKFKEFKGIKKVAIEIETGDFRFTYPSEKKLAMNTVLKQVKKAGYTPKSAKIIRANGKEEVLEKTISVQVNGRSDLKKDRFVVKGNCDMCKARIVNAALSVKGVSEAEWNVETKILDVQYLKQETSLDAIAEIIASQGHDSENALAENSVYDNLPACCNYRDTKK